MKQKRLVYIASPYTVTEKNKTPEEIQNIQHQRFIQVAEECARLMYNGMPLYSPIVHFHPIIKYGNINLKAEWEFWEWIDRPMLKTCTELMVLKMEGWDKSLGVKEEIKLAKEFKKPIIYHNIKASQ